jgi:hypothetical protein
MIDPPDLSPCSYAEDGVQPTVDELTPRVVLGGAPFRSVSMGGYHVVAATEVKG